MRSQGGQTGHAPSNLWGLIVILDFEKWYPKQTSVFRLKSNIPHLPILLIPVVLHPCCRCGQQCSPRSLQYKFFLPHDAHFCHPHKSNLLAYYALLHHCEILRVISRVAESEVK